MSCCNIYQDSQNSFPNVQQISACKKAMRNFALHPPIKGSLCVKRNEENKEQYDSMIKVLNGTNTKNSNLLNSIAIMVVRNHLMNVEPKSFIKNSMGLEPVYNYNGGNCGGQNCGQGPNPVIADVILNMLNLDLDIEQRSIESIVMQLSININKDQVRQLYPEYFDENPNPSNC